MFENGFDLNVVNIVESHFFASVSPGLDDRIVWNIVEEFVCFKDSLENSDFCLLTIESFLFENCKNGA